MLVHAGIRHYRSNEEIYRSEHYDGVLEGLKIFAADSLLFRAAFDNWATGPEDIAILQEAVLDIGRRLR